MRKRGNEWSVRGKKSDALDDENADDVRQLQWHGESDKNRSYLHPEECVIQ